MTNQYDLVPGVQVGESAVVPLFANETECEPVNISESRRRSSKFSPKTTLAALTSTAVIALLVLICRFSHGTQIRPGNKRRELSGDGHSFGSKSQGLCEHADDGSNSESPKQSVPARIQLGLIEPSSKRQRLETLKTGGSSTLASADEPRSQAEAEASGTSSKNKTKHHVSFAASASFPGEAVHAMPYSTFQLASTSAAVGDHFYSKSRESRSTDELEAARGLLLLQTRALESTTPPDGDSQLHHFRGHLETARSVGHFDVALSGMQRITTSNAASTPTELISVLQTQPSFEDLSRHKYCRLPVVQSLGPNRRIFDPFRALKRSSGGRPLGFYERLGTLFAKETLSDDDYDDVVVQTQHFVASLINYEDYPVPLTSSYRMITTLGRRFLELDMLVSSLGILNVPLDSSWWKTFTDKIPHIVSENDLDRVSPHGCSSRKRIVRLVSAIQELKSGSRPENRMLIELKRMLFCGPEAPLDIRMSKWNLWLGSDGGAC